MDYVILLQSGGDGSGAISTIVSLIIAVFFVACFWQILVKAGEPGWQAIIPIWNYIVLLKIVGRPWWWLLLGFIPIVNFIVSILVSIDLAKSFGRGTGFGIGIFLLSVIFIPILAFGSDRYIGPAAASK